MAGPERASRQHEDVGSRLMNARINRNERVKLSFLGIQEPCNGRSLAPHVLQRSSQALKLELANCTERDGIYTTVRDFAEGHRKVSSSWKVPLANPGLSVLVVLSRA